MAGRVEFFDKAEDFRRVMLYFTIFLKSPPVKKMHPSPKKFPKRKNLRLS